MIFLMALEKYVNLPGYNISATAQISVKLVSNNYFYTKKSDPNFELHYLHTAVPVPLNSNSWDFVCPSRSISQMSLTNRRIDRKEGTS